MIEPPTTGEGQNVQGRRDPVGNRHEGGNRDTLQGLSANQANDATTSETQNNWERAPTQNESHTTNDADNNSTTQRLRNEPDRRLNQPRRQKQTLKITTLNMNGKGNRSQDKWGSVNNVMKRRKIAVMALQETHPTDDMQENIGKRFRNTLHIVHSADPENPGSKGGVSIAVNKGMVNTNKITSTIVIAGRAIIIDIPWNGDDTLRILNVYAPVRNAEKTEFWTTLLEKIETMSGPKPDIVLGDFNLVENPEIDRLNNRGGTDPITARNALSDLVVELNLTDGWRRRHPRKRGYTYVGNGQSRLDRIYAREEMYQWCTDWKIEHPGVKTDHSLVGVQITSENMPFLGRGRWMIPINLLKNKYLKKETQKLAKQMQDEVNQTRTQNRTDHNPQKALKTFKEKVVELYRNYQKTNQPKLTNAIKSLQKELQTTADKPELTEEQIQEQTLLLTERIDALEKKRRDEARLLSSARNKLEGETLSKHWVRSAKENTPRDTIRTLINPLGDPNRKETRSDKMAQIAKEYHEQLLTIDRDPRTEPDEEKLHEALENINTRLAQEDIEELRKSVSSEEVEEALNDSANDKAAGLDGIPMELWKLLNQQYKSAKEDERHNYCNIVNVLTKIFRDVADYGVTEGTNFNEGWMCPIYKKKEANNIANYRPITVLNTDYKIFTKAIATRLTGIAPKIIHPDQAGFIRGRSIFDQIEQAATTINYAKLKGINGAIVALDQEKAYDKITHPYLWKILEKFAFPTEMINTIKALYRDAPTSVIINGMISEPFLVTRGVRQGDPMSCILFDLGIEPLAANIRASNIKGIDVPNLDEKVKVSLFADDTTVILTEHDSFTELTEITSKWCEVSGAKFNVEKTELIPIGTAEYREKLIETRELSEGEIVPQTIHIAREKESTRLLGAWIGNDVNPEEPWRKIIETIKKDFKRWEARYPTLEGRRHIVQMIAGGKTQFLARAQGMPETIEKEIQKAITEFVWGKERASMNIENIAKDIDKGGRKIMNVSRRNEAIDLMWVKQYLNMGKERPKWAYMMDEIFRNERPKRAKETPQEIGKWNPLIQNWKPKLNAAGIPKRVHRALKWAKKHNVEIEALEPNEETKREMPVWLHRKTSKEAARIYSTDAAKCLKNKHCTHYMRQLRDITENVPGNHRKTNFCTCELCIKMSTEGCTYPNRCIETAGKLIEAIAPKWRPEANQDIDKETEPIQLVQLQRDELVVNTKREPTDLKRSIRIFTNQENLVEATVLPEVENPQQTELVIYTDGSCINNGTADAKAGCGVWYGNEDTRNMAIRVPGKEQSNQIGELLAILHAVQNTPGNQDLRICSDSRFAIDGLTKHAQNWEAKDWIAIRHGKLFKCTTAWIRARTGKTTLKWVKGHAGIEGNEGADKLAAEGTQKEPERTEIDLRIPADTMVTGANLADITQSMIYHHLTNKGDMSRIATKRSIEKIQIATKEIFGTTPTEQAIWKSMRHKDVTRKIRDFLWKNAHGLYRLGNFWKHIPGCEDRAECPICGKEDTLAHIITECDSVEKNTVWDQTNELWKRRYNSDIPTSEGAVLGGGLASFTKENGRPDTGKNRLYRILITEAAHLIWVLRCERRISGGDNPEGFHSQEAVKNRWHKKINERMQIDCLLTNKYLYETRAQKTKTVYKTWEKCSTNTEDLHRDWCRHPGVLVGKTPRRPPGRHR